MSTNNMPPPLSLSTASSSLQQWISFYNHPDAQKQGQVKRSFSELAQEVEETKASIDQRKFSTIIQSVELETVGKNQGSFWIIVDGRKGWLFPKLKLRSNHWPVVEFLFQIPYKPNRYDSIEVKQPARMTSSDGQRWQLEKRGAIEFRGAVVAKQEPAQAKRSAAQKSPPAREVEKSSVSHSAAIDPKQLQDLVDHLVIQKVNAILPSYVANLVKNTSTETDASKKTNHDLNKILENLNNRIQELENNSDSLKPKEDNELVITINSRIDKLEADLQSSTPETDYIQLLNKLRERVDKLENQSHYSAELEDFKIKLNQLSAHLKRLDSQRHYDNASVERGEDWNQLSARIQNLEQQLQGAALSTVHSDQWQELRTRIDELDASKLLPADLEQIGILQQLSKQVQTLEGQLNTLDPSRTKEELKNLSERVKQFNAQPQPLVTAQNQSDEIQALERRLARLESQSHDYEIFETRTSEGLEILQRQIYALASQLQTAVINQNNSDDLDGPETASKHEEQWQGLSVQIQGMSAHIQAISTRIRALETVINTSLKGLQNEEGQRQEVKYERESKKLELATFPKAEKVNPPYSRLIELYNDKNKKLRVVEPIFEKDCQEAAYIPNCERVFEKVSKNKGDYWMLFESQDIAWLFPKFDIKRFYKTMPRVKAFDCPPVSPAEGVRIQVLKPAKVKSVPNRQDIWELAEKGELSW